MQGPRRERIVDHEHEAPFRRARGALGRSIDEPLGTKREEQPSIAQRRDTVEGLDPEQLRRQRPDDEVLGTHERVDHERHGAVRRVQHHDRLARGERARRGETEHPPEMRHRQRLVTEHEQAPTA